MALCLYYLQWLILVKFYPLDPLNLDFFADFHWDMSGNLINIYNLCYNTVVLKKIAKTFTDCSFRTLFGQKLSQQRPCPKSSSIFFFWRYHKLFRTFYLSKYHKFWLSYEWFYALYDILLLKPAIFGWNVGVVQGDYFVSEIMMMIQVRKKYCAFVIVYNTIGKPCH